MIKPLERKMWFHNLSRNRSQPPLPPNRNQVLLNKFHLKRKIPWDWMSKFNHIYQIPKPLKVGLSGKDLGLGSMHSPGQSGTGIIWPTSSLFLLHGCYIIHTYHAAYSWHYFLAISFLHNSRLWKLSSKTLTRKGPVDKRSCL